MKYNNLNNKKETKKNKILILQNQTQLHNPNKSKKHLSNNKIMKNKIMLNNNKS